MKQRIKRCYRQGLAQKKEFGILVENNFTNCDGIGKDGKMPKFVGSFGPGTKTNFAFEQIVGCFNNISAKLSHKSGAH